MTFTELAALCVVLAVLLLITDWRRRAHLRVRNALLGQVIWVVETRLVGDPNDSTLCELFYSEEMAKRWIGREDPDDWEGGYFALYSQPINAGQHTDLDFTWNTYPDFYWPGTTEKLPEQPDGPDPRLLDNDGFIDNALGEPDDHVEDEKRG